MLVEPTPAAKAPTAAQFPPFVPDPERESRTRARLRAYLERIGRGDVERAVEELFALDSGIRDRFNYFAPRMPAHTRRRILVSGCAAGSEMIMARDFGFEEVVGSEVTAEYVDICRERLSGQAGFRPLLYDGRWLPLASGSCTAVVSGHIIEHTPSPFAYLREHMRVLVPGGWMFLEFPDRYHHTELHTGLPSVEFLPKALRSLALGHLASSQRLSPHERKRYGDIKRTLQPVSLWQVSLYLQWMGCRHARIAHHYSPAPGYLRLLIVK